MHTNNRYVTTYVGAEALGSDIIAPHRTRKKTRNIHSLENMLLIHHHSMERRLFFRALSTLGCFDSILPSLRISHHAEISSLPEILAREKLRSFLEHNLPNSIHAKENGVMIDRIMCSSQATHLAVKHVLSPEQIRVVLDASMATFHLHVESRVAALCGQGFYTIGPCGEEVLSSAACALQPQDTVALHYRHLGISISRSLLSGGDLQEIILNRARAYVVSKKDPVTGGVHCALGGSKNDYVVTSTLASQCPPAVGRALGFSLAAKLHDRRNNARPISFVSIGDGSIHNAHFLSSLNLARHARFRRISCPMVFAISDNGLSISYKTEGYVAALLETLSDGPVGLPVFKADGCNAWEIYDQTLQAVEYARRRSAPAIVLYNNISRRFGHAASDRQFAYRSEEEIRTDQERDIISGLIAQSVREGIITCDEILKRYDYIQKLTREAFDIAAEEPKHDNRVEMMQRVSAPYINVPRLSKFLINIGGKKDFASCDNIQDDCDNQSYSATSGKKDVMRKHMTRVIAETLERYREVVYMGEDVRHGGYYLVTDGLKNRYPSQVLDFPPDETTLIGAAIGFSQSGICPIVEIPYAKYLDCGADMFFEAALLHWLTAGQQSNGMVVRLQGFDRGTFGGNFHTHNMLHMPPGVDVLCYSNGLDYVRGFRNAVVQARAGRIVMLVDSTNLLNLRHLFDKDRAWERYYPRDINEMMGYHDVIRYTSSPALTNAGKVAIITYGNGVISALQGRREWLQGRSLDLYPSSNQEGRYSAVDVIDCPLLSDVPNGLKEMLLHNYDHVIFADVCKLGLSPLSSAVVQLQAEKLLPASWLCVSAPRTYNPLGSTITFLGPDDIVHALNSVASHIGRCENDAQRIKKTIRSS